MAVDTRDSVVHVFGLRELVRATRVASVEMARDLRTAIEQSGEPIRSAASRLAFTEISGMRRGRLPWHEMRSGVIRQTIGYIAPARRSTGRKSPTLRRPNLAPKLLNEAEIPALQQNQTRVISSFEAAVADMARAWENV